jgi:SAM-dependent methyltransferase
MTAGIRRVAQAFPAVRRWRYRIARRAQAPRERWIPPGSVDFGALRRTTPISPLFALDRGYAIDRHYIEQFLGEFSHLISGRVLEIGGDDYTRRFGGTRVTESHVLHVEPGHAGTTVVADLTEAPELPDEAFDCIICTQTLQFIYDTAAVVKTLERILAPRGAVLATFAGVSQISRYDMDRWGDYWRITSRAAQMLFEQRFTNVSVRNYGNVLACVAFLHGVAASELTQAELAYCDRDYELIVAVCAGKS